MWIRKLGNSFYSRLWLDVAKKIGKRLFKKEISENWQSLNFKFAFFKPKNNNNFIPTKIVLVAEVRDIEYAIKIAALSKTLAEKNNCSIKSYNVYIDIIDNSYLSKKDAFVKKVTSFCFKHATETAYNAFTSGRIHDNSKKFYNQAFVKREAVKLAALINVENLNSINALSIEGIVVGDLIYDTYLRSFHQPTITSINYQLNLVIEWAINIFYSFKEVLKKYSICYLVNTYTCYLHFGIVTRLCLANEIKVYTLGSISYRVQLIPQDFPYHQVNYSLFNCNKVLSIEQKNKTKEIFEKRFNGEIDSATSYMRQSAFSRKKMPIGLEESFKLRKRNIIIYTHDFYDSPHVGRNLAFADLYQFLKQTLEALVNLQDTTVFIKTHPNGIDGNKEETVSLVNTFKQENFLILDEMVSNLHIIELKPDLIATARGTVCIEMAYMGITTVALYDNIFCNFAFTHTCYSKEEYFEILNGNKQPIIDFDKDKILSFYYQAYIENIETDKSDLLNYLASSKLETYSNQYADYILKRKDEIFSNKLLDEFASLV